MFVTEIDPKAFHAIRAAENERQWGERAARRYARKHSCFQLYQLARMIHRNPESV